MSASAVLHTLSFDVGRLIPRSTSLAAHEKYVVGGRRATTDSPKTAGCNRQEAETQELQETQSHDTDGIERLYMPAMATSRAAALSTVGSDMPSDSEGPLPFVTVFVSPHANNVAAEAAAASVAAASAALFDGGLWIVGAAATAPLAPSSSSTTACAPTGCHRGDDSAGLGASKAADAVSAAAGQGYGRRPHDDTPQDALGDTRDRTGGARGGGGDGKHSDVAAHLGAECGEDRQHSPGNGGDARTTGNLCVDDAAACNTRSVCTVAAFTHTHTAPGPGPSLDLDKHQHGQQERQHPGCQRPQQLDDEDAALQECALPSCGSGAYAALLERLALLSPRIRALPAAAWDDPDAVAGALAADMPDVATPASTPTSVFAPASAFIATAPVAAAAAASPLLPVPLPAPLPAPGDHCGPEEAAGQQSQVELEQRVEDLQGLVASLVAALRAAQTQTDVQTQSEAHTEEEVEADGEAPEQSKAHVQGQARAQPQKRGSALSPCPLSPPPSPALLATNPTAAATAPVTPAAPASPSPLQRPASGCIPQPRWRRNSVGGYASPAEAEATPSSTQLASPKHTSNSVSLTPTPSPTAGPRSASGRYGAAAAAAVGVGASGGHGASASLRSPRKSAPGGGGDGGGGGGFRRYASASGTSCDAPARRGVPPPSSPRVLGTIGEGAPLTSPAGCADAVTPLGADCVEDPVDAGMEYRYMHMPWPVKQAEPAPARGRRSSCPGESSFRVPAASTFSVPAVAAAIVATSPRSLPTCATRRRASIGGPEAAAAAAGPALSPAAAAAAPRAFGVASLRRSMVAAPSSSAQRPPSYGDHPAFVAACQDFEAAWRATTADGDGRRWALRAPPTGVRALPASPSFGSSTTSAAQPAGVAGQPARLGSFGPATGCQPHQSPAQAAAAVAAAAEREADAAVAALMALLARHQAPLQLAKSGPMVYDMQGACGGMCGKRLQLKLLTDGRLAVRRGGGWEELTAVLARMPLPSQRRGGATAIAIATAAAVALAAAPAEADAVKA